MPIIKTSETLRTIDAGGLVEVVSDDPAIVSDLPAWCKSHGHTIESCVEETGVYRYLVRKRMEAYD
jgi:TusA-related sulfurtransferase